MTLRLPTVALFSLLWIVPALAQAQATQDAVPDAPAGASVLQVQDRARSDHPRQHAHPAHHCDSTAGR